VNPPSMSGGTVNPGRAVGQGEIMAERVRLKAEGDLADDLLWGADSIAGFIGRPLRGRPNKSGSS
jgi:hypothetical protein